MWGPSNFWTWNSSRGLRGSLTSKLGDLADQSGRPVGDPRSRLCKTSKLRGLVTLRPEGLEFGGVESGKPELRRAASPWTLEDFESKLRDL